jgi:hypothetical protein
VAIAPRIPVDLDAAWRKAVSRVGDEGELHRRPRIGSSEGALRELLRRAAVVEAYVASRFGPFSSAERTEVDKAWRTRSDPQAQGGLSTGS